MGPALIRAYRMGAYSRWALIRGWTLNRINTVNIGLKEHNRDIRNFGTCQQGKWNRNSSNAENNLNANKKKRYQTYHQWPCETIMRLHVFRNVIYQSVFTYCDCSVFASHRI